MTGPGQRPGVARPGQRPGLAGRRPRPPGERLNDGLSAFSTGHGPPLVVLPGLGQDADLAAGVPRTVAWPNTLLATGLKRSVEYYRANLARYL